jgi:peptide/nickel transport system ATP-binding protein
MVETTRANVLEADDVCVSFNVPGGAIRAVDGVSFRVAAGETLAVVGESGCGKTTLAKATLGLEPLVRGEIRVQDETVGPSLKGLAGRVGIVWQDPYASLDARWRIGNSIGEPISVNPEVFRARFPGCDPADRITEVMRAVGLDPEMARRFPHQLSGGQRQRVAVARALVLDPPLVLCDEPTAALDLSIRAQILNLLKEIQERLGCAYLYISHDLTTVRYIADRVAVMYLGKFVEVGDTESVFAQPRHPYTRALLDSAPTLATLGRLPTVLPGEIPDPREVQKGCPFKARCSYKSEQCETKFPDEATVGSQSYFCHHPLATR